MRDVDSPLLVSPDHVRYNIKLSSQLPECVVVTDECVRIRRSGNPIISTECKSRDGSTGYKIYDKIFAQEFAEVLAVMLDREKKMFHFDNKDDAFRVVYPNITIRGDGGSISEERASAVSGFSGSCTLMLTSEACTTG